MLFCFLFSFSTITPRLQDTSARNFRHFLSLSQLVGTTNTNCARKKSVVSDVVKNELVFGLARGSQKGLIKLLITPKLIEQFQKIKMHFEEQRLLYHSSRHPVFSHVALSIGDHLYKHLAFKSNQSLVKRSSSDAQLYGVSSLHSTL